MLIKDLLWARSQWILKAENEEHRIKARAGDSRKETVKAPGKPHGDIQAKTYLGPQHHVDPVWCVAKGQEARPAQ